MAASRYILLGASNLVLALPRILAGLRRGAPRPLEVLVACGHGRSFGQPSTVLGIRELPGILGCGLWRVLEGLPPQRARALITDPGNDLAYGVAVEELLEWMEETVRRLQDRACEVVLTLPPVAATAALPAWRYALLRRLLFPGCRDPLPVMQDKVRALDGGLRRLAARRGVPAVEPDPGWFGFDAIHLRASARRRAWERILQGWPGAEALPAPTWGQRWRVWSLLPAERKVLGRRRTASQPREAGLGARIYLY